MQNYVLKRKRIVRNAETATSDAYKYSSILFLEEIVLQSQKSTKCIAHVHYNHTDLTVSASLEIIQERINKSTI